MSGELVLKKSFPTAALAADDGPAFASVAPLAGYIKKKSRGGSWQSRWFYTRNHFLLYTHSNRDATPQAAVDLSTLDDVIVVGRFGEFNLAHQDGGVFSLKAANVAQANQWVQGLRARQEAHEQAASKAEKEASKRASTSQPGGSAAGAAAGAAGAAAAGDAAAAASTAGADAQTKLRSKGYMMKKGAQRHNWKRRYFVLTAECVAARGASPGASRAGAAGGFGHDVIPPLSAGSPFAWCCTTSPLIRVCPPALPARCCTRTCPWTRRRRVASRSRARGCW